MTKEIHRLYRFYFMNNNPKESGYWIDGKPFGIYKLTNWLDWRIDFKWVSFTIWIE